MISPLKFLILSMIPYDISYYGPYLSHLKRLQVTLGGSYILHLARNRKEDEELQIQRMRCIIELRFGVLYNSVNLRNISPDAPTCLLFLFLSLRMNRHIIARKKGPSPSLAPNPCEEDTQTQSIVCQIFSKSNDPISTLAGAILRAAAGGLTSCRILFCSLPAALNALVVVVVLCGCEYYL